MSAEGWSGQIRLSSLVDKIDWARWRLRDENLFEFPEQGPRPEEIMGGVLILYRFIPVEGSGPPRAKTVIFAQEELKDKPEWDKMRGDYGPVAESRREGESMKEMFGRGLYEETGLRIWNELIQVDREPVGFFQFTPREGDSRPRWIVAGSAWVHDRLLERQQLCAVDGETTNHHWVEVGRFLREYPVRGGMLGIVDQWAKGERNLVMGVGHGRHTVEQGFGLDSGGVLDKTDETMLVNIRQRRLNG